MAFLPFKRQFFCFQAVRYAASEVPTIKDSNQTMPDVIESAPTAEETISKPSEYEVLRTNSIAKKNRAIQTKLEKVISYTKQTMVAYMSEEDLNRLCAYIVEYSSGDTLQKISPVKVDSQLKSVDIMHFGWNIGKAFSKKRIHTATFIKNVFAHTLRDLEVSTIERKMSHTESVCSITIGKYNTLSSYLKTQILFNYILKSRGVVLSEKLICFSAPITETFKDIVQLNEPSGCNVKSPSLHSNI